MKAVKYANITAILVEAIKTQDRTLQDLQRRGEAQSRQIDALIKRLEIVEKRKDNR